MKVSTHESGNLGHFLFRRKLKVPMVVFAFSGKDNGQPHLNCEHSPCAEHVFGLRGFLMSKIFILPVFVAFLVSFSGVFAAAEKEAVMLATAVDKARVDSGESIKFTIELKTIKQLDVSIPEIGDKILGFRVIDYGKDDTFFEDGYNVQVAWYLLEADIGGDYIIPSIAIKYTDAKGAAQTLQSSEIFVAINSQVKTDKDGKPIVDAVGEQAKDIRGLKNIYRTKIDYKKFLIIFGLLLLLFGGAFLVYRRMKNKKVAVVIIPPHILAKQQLDSLNSENLSSVDEIKQYYFELSIIIRNYFEGQFTYPATDRTFQEINKDIFSAEMISGPELEIDEKKIFLSILDKADVVKFTDFSPAAESMLQIKDEALAFVVTTTPIVKIEDEEDSVI